ncbi:MAG TPA: GAF domain-containing protein [Reyranella sp.]|jgi:hypothetical protein|nr:GAF domain-containing protein [Reyranella sp.]
MTALDKCIAAVKSGPAETLFKAVEGAVDETVGVKLFTLLYVAPDRKRVKRLYTNMPREYPVGGYKEIRDTPWHRHVVQGMRPWVGRNAKDIEWAFFDHELILSLGCESAINVPVVYCGRLLGTMNLLDKAGHYKESDVAKCEPFAYLLVGPFLDAIAADPDIGR